MRRWNGKGQNCKHTKDMIRRLCANKTTRQVNRRAIYDNENKMHYGGDVQQCQAALDPPLLIIRPALAPIYLKDSLYTLLWHVHPPISLCARHCWHHLDRHTQGEKHSLQHIKAINVNSIDVASSPHPASHFHGHFPKLIAVTGQKSQPCDLQFTKMVSDIVQLGAQQLGY